MPIMGGIMIAHLSRTEAEYSSTSDVAQNRRTSPQPIGLSWLSSVMILPRCSFQSRNLASFVNDVALVPETCYNLVSLGCSCQQGNELKAGRGKTTNLRTDLTIWISVTTYSRNA